jgi:hypothetical protein
MVEDSLAACELLDDGPDRQLVLGLFDRAAVDWGATGVRTVAALLKQHNYEGFARWLAAGYGYIGMEGISLLQGLMDAQQATRARRCDTEAVLDAAAGVKGNGH